MLVEPHDGSLIQEAVREVLGGCGPSRLCRQWVAAGKRDSVGTCISLDRLRGTLSP